jgi:PAS domain S-box-containing protein
MRTLEGSSGWADLAPRLLGPHVEPFLDIGGRVSARRSSSERTNELFSAAAANTPLAGGGADYRALANALPHIVWTTTADGRPLWVNDRWYEFTGLGEQESLRGGALAAIHPDDLGAMERARQNALATSTVADVEYRLRRHDGMYRWHLSRAVPVRGSDGEVARWVATVLDVHDRRTAENALHESEHRFETVFNLIPQATAIIRLSDGAHLQINDAFSLLTGFTREDVIGQSTVSLGIWTPEERAKYVAPIIAPPGGTTVVPLRTKDGRELHLGLSSRHIDFGGEPCMITVGIDLTEQQAHEAALRLGESQARARADELAALMDAVPAAVWISRDPECRDIRGNRAAYEILHVRSGENMYGPAMNRRFTFFIDGEEVPVDQLPLERAARGEEVRSNEEEVRFEDGEVRHLYGSAVTLRDSAGAPRGAIGAYVDVTRLKEAEAALRVADRRKDEFLALLSHELRNPLTPILSAAQLLKVRADAEAQIDLDVIIRQARHLVRLVDDLLDVSSVARGKVTLAKRRLELSVIVAKAVEVTGRLLEARRHRLELSVPAEGLAVDADDVRLTQVVNNLLSNAARYTPPGGVVTVTATREADDVVLRVRDSGMGIDPALLPDLFDMFVQGDRGSDRSQGGLGLGLSLVRSLTELHGGSVTAHSDGPGLGSEFTVRLPAATAADGLRILPTDYPPSRAATGGESARVLVVDDNRDVAHMIARLMTAAGFETRTAGDPWTALAIAETFRPVVAILDIGLPIMDGYALARELRTRLGDSTPNLIALTGYSQDRDRQRSRDAGFSIHLSKPVDAEELVQAVQGRAFTQSPA